MRVVLSILAVINFVVFWTVLFRFGAGSMTAVSRVWLATVLVAAGIAYFRGRGRDVRSATVRLILVAVFTAPLAVLLLWHRILTVYTMFGPAFGRPQEWFFGCLILPLLSAYYTLPTFRGVMYVMATVGFLVFAIWKPTFAFHRWKMSFMSIITFCYVAYLLHWYLTGQKWVWL
ncbi:MAG: hypothetical protein ABI680_13435 [Chthoniobacteraceae bacterium]